MKRSAALAARRCSAVRHRHPTCRRLPDPPAVGLHSLTADGLTSASLITTIRWRGRSLFTVISCDLSVKGHRKISADVSSCLLLCNSQLHRDQLGNSTFITVISHEGGVRAVVDLASKKISLFLPAGTGSREGAATGGRERSGVMTARRPGRGSGQAGRDALAAWHGVPVGAGRGSRVASAFHGGSGRSGISRSGEDGRHPATRSAIVASGGATTRSVHKVPVAGRCRRLCRTREIRRYGLRTAAVLGERPAHVGEFCALV